MNKIRSIIMVGNNKEGGSNAEVERSRWKNVNDREKGNEQ